MPKIKISTISQKCHAQNGFGHDGCISSNCGDACCRYGADFDRTAFNLIIEHRDLVESVTGVSAESCFEEQWSGEVDYLGGDSIRSLVGPSGFCVFHTPEGKGCVLYKLVFENNVSRRILPSICRLYPLTWTGGELSVYDEGGDAVIEPDCVCLDPVRSSSRNLLLTQKHEIDDIFEHHIPSN